MTFIEQIREIAACTLYQRDAEVEIDPKASVMPVETGGCWVQAWVYVSQPMIDKFVEKASLPPLPPPPPFGDLRAAAQAALTYLEDDCEPHWSPEQRDVVETLRAALR